MDVQRYAFLQAILGTDGAQALAKATERQPALAPVLIPRAIMSWLDLLDRDGDYEGDLPGVDNAYLEFAKSECGYTGIISVGNSSWGFEAATSLHLAASIGVALGVDADALDPEMRNVDLQRLGKSLDLLVKARAVAAQLGKRQLDPNAGYTFSHNHFNDDVGPSIGQTVGRPETFWPKRTARGDLYTEVVAHDAQGQVAGRAGFLHVPNGQHIQAQTVRVEPEHQRKGLASAMYAHAEKLTGKKVVPDTAQSPDGQALWAGNAKAPQFGKVEAAGPAAAPQKQGEPQGPQAPQKQPPLPKPRVAKPPSLKLSEADARRPCPVCGLSQFHGERLVGCLCFSELSKSTKTIKTLDGFEILFGEGWDVDSLEVFVSGFQRRVIV